MIDIAVVLGAFNLARTVAELTGLIETIGVKIDRLSQSDLQAAFRALDQAQRATTESESLLREARTRLNKALSLEKEERLAAAYLALAATHHQLGDVANTRQVLREFLDTEFSPPLARLAEQIDTNDEAKVLVGLAIVHALPLAVHGLIWMAKQRGRTKQIRDIKEAVRRYLDLDSGPPANV
jgi:hypothetical protein